MSTLFAISLLCATSIWFAVIFLGWRVMWFFQKRRGVFRVVPPEHPLLPTRYVCYCDNCVISHHKREIRQRNIEEFKTAYKRDESRNLIT